METSHIQRAVIVGATQGIGLALARELRGQGLRVTVTGRSRASVDRALGALNADGGQPPADGLVLDLADHAEAAAVLSGAGAIDHLVLCGASEVAWGPFATLQVAAVERALHVKLAGFLLAAQAALPQLAERGSITFVGGAASRAAMSGTVGLAVVNGALEAATLTLARELSPRRVNLVSPGMTDTEAYAGMPAEARRAQFEAVAQRLPARRIGSPQDVARAVAMVVTNPYVTGSIVDVDGGAHLG